MIQDGGGKAFTVVPLPCQSSTAAALAGAGACTVPDFLSFLQGRMLTQQAWCTACANYAV